MVFILKNGWSLLKESTAVLMDATPGHINLGEVRIVLEKMPGVRGVHYLHAWRVSSDSNAFSCHVVVEDQPVSGTERLAEHIKDELWNRFRIDHPVLQFETEACGHGTLLCEMVCSGGAGGGKGDVSGTPSLAPETVSPRTGRVQQWSMLGLRLFMGAVFLYASYDKILHPHAFAQAIYNYQILPDAAVNLVALILPWLELLLGLCLIAGVWQFSAAVTSTVLLTVFIGALVFNLSRGLNIHCGCFSTEGSPADLWTVLRDALLLTASVSLSVMLWRQEGSSGQ